jgi:hypothetical protein
MTRSADKVLAKHTPGPWHLAERQLVTLDDFGKVRYCCDDGRAAAEAANVRGVLVHGPYHGGSCGADARLIAAAPDLLEALRDLVEATQHIEGDGADNLWFSRARTAIAKAEFHL